MINSATFFGRTSSSERLTLYELSFHDELKPIASSMMGQGGDDLRQSRRPSRDYEPSRPIILFTTPQVSVPDFVFSLLRSIRFPVDPCPVCPASRSITSYGRRGDNSQSTPQRTNEPTDGRDGIEATERDVWSSSCCSSVVPYELDVLPSSKRDVASSGHVAPLPALLGSYP